MPDQALQPVQTLALNNNQAARELPVCAQTNESISIKAVPDQAFPPVPTLALNNDQAAGELAVCFLMLL